MAILTGKLAVAEAKLGASFALGTHSISVGPLVLDRTSITTWVITDSAVPILPIPVDAIDTLVLTQSSTAILTTFGRLAIDSLGLTQVSTSNLKNLISFDILDLSDAARIPLEFLLSAIDTLTLTQSNVRTGSSSVIAFNTLVFGSTADVSEKARDVVSTLVLAQSSTAEIIKTCVSTLVLTQVAAKEAIDLACFSNLILSDSSHKASPVNVAATSDLSLTQNVTNSIRATLSVSTLTLSDNIVTQRPISVSAVNDMITEEVTFDPITGDPSITILGLSQESSVQLNAQPDTATFLSFSQAATSVLIPVGGISVASVSTLSLTQSALLGLQLDGSSTLSLTQDSTSNIVDGGGTDMTLTDQSTVHIIRASTPASSELNLRQTVSYTLLKADTECDYSPFVGTTSDPSLPTPPPTELPRQFAFTTGTRFRLVYPDFTVTRQPDIEVILRPPSLGNTEAIQSMRINRESRSGKSIIFSDPAWPKFYRMVVQFSDLKRTQAYDTLSFIDRTLGQVIGVEDHEGRAWKGLIVNPDDVLVQDRDNRYSISLEMELDLIRNVDFTGSNLLSFSQAAVVTLTPGLKQGVTSWSLSQVANSGLNKLEGGLDNFNISGIASAIFTKTRGATSGLSLGDISYGSIGFPDFGALIHRWDATELTNLVDENQILNVPDTGSVPVALSMLDMEATRAPIYKTNIINGLPVMRFDHSIIGQGLESDSLLSLFPAKRGTIAILLIPRQDISSGSNSRVIFESRNLPALEQLRFGEGSHTNRPISWAQNPDGTETIETPGIDFIPENEPQLLIISRTDDNTITFRRNEVDKSGRSLPTGDVSPTGTLLLGGNGVVSTSMNYDLAFFVAYDTALSATQIAGIESYVNVTYGV